jgi:hypothetical protein
MINIRSGIPRAVELVSYELQLVKFRLLDLSKIASEFGYTTTYLRFICLSSNLDSKSTLTSKYDVCYDEVAGSGVEGTRQG